MASQKQKAAQGESGKRAFARHFAIAAIALVLVMVAGEWLEPEVLKLKNWIASQGPKGPIFFLIIFIVLSSVFVPDTVFAVIAGTLFGILWGYATYVYRRGNRGDSQFLSSENAFSTAGSRFPHKHPRFSVVEQAAEHEGLRLLLLLRLVPLNPATVSYLLGTTGIRFPVFFFACIGLIPGFFVEVYFGYLLNHMSMVKTPTGSFDMTHLVVTIAGFVLCTGTLVYLIVLARRALAELSMQEK